MFSKFIWVNIDSETAEIYKKGDCGVGATLYYDLKYNR